MNRSLFAATALTLCAPAFAQTVYSPHASYQSNAGGGYAYFLGSVPGGRYQLADGNLRGSFTVVTSISYRLDNNLFYTENSGMGRAWANVTLKLSDCNIATMTTACGPKSWPRVFGLESTRRKPSTSIWSERVAPTFVLCGQTHGREEVVGWWRF